jgi:protein SMG6
MRGMEWASRRVFERGYWKPGEDRKRELEVLDKWEASAEGAIEDEGEDRRRSMMWARII